MSCVGSWIRQEWTGAHERATALRRGRRRSARDARSVAAAEGYEVTAVAAAEDAIVELQSGGYQLLLTDYNLPNKNASWMLQVARAAGCLQNVHVVVLSAAVDPVGVEGYQVLRKPVDLSLLFTALDAAVASLAKQIDAGCEPSSSDTSAVALTLYVTGSSRESTKALRNLRRVLQKFEGRHVRLVVCDVTELDGGRLDDAGDGPRCRHADTRAPAS